MEKRMKRLISNKHLRSRKFMYVVTLTIFFLACSTSGCIVSRLVTALNSYIISEVYVQMGDTPKLISPGIGEGLFVTPNINSEGNEVIFHGAIGGYSRIWKYNLNTDTITALTDEDYVAVEPCFSWDGTQIAFAADKGIDQKREDMINISTNVLKMGMMYLGGDPDILNIFVMNSDGSNLRQITEWKAVDMRPTFSPDGQHVLFMSTYKSGTIKKRDLYKVSVSGDGEPEIIPNSEGANRPWYSADGEWIYYWKEIEDRGTLCRIKADGSEWHPIAGDTGGIGSHGPFIDPNGEWLWFHSVREKDDPINQIYKMPIDGGDSISITPLGFEREHVAHVTAASNDTYSFDVLKVLKKKSK